MRRFLNNVRRRVAHWLWPPERINIGSYLYIDLMGTARRVQINEVSVRVTNNGPTEVTFKCTDAALWQRRGA